MTKKTDAPKSASKPHPKPASHVDVAPRKTTAAERAASPLHTGDDPGSMPPQPAATTAADRDPDHRALVEPDPAIAPLPMPPPAALSVAVPDPDPQPEAHYPSGADEIMRRHRLVDPATAEAKTEAEAETKAEEDSGKGNAS